MGDWIASLFAKVGADVSGFKQGMSTVKTEMKSAEQTVKSSQISFKGMSDTVKMLGGAMTAYGVASAAKYTLELDVLGRQSIRLTKEFENLAKQHELSSDGIIRSLREASGNTINDMDLMVNANRALKYELVDTEEEFKNLMLAARFYGRQMGVNTLEAYQRMVNGIGKGSREIIDDLGIVGISFEQGGDKAELMAQVIDQAMKEIAISGGVLDDEADRTARLAASVENLQEQWGVLVAKSGVVDLVVNVATHGVESWSQMLSDIQVIDAWAKEHDTKFIDVVIGVPGAQDTLNQLTDFMSKTPFGLVATGPVGVTISAWREIYNMYQEGQQQTEQMAADAALATQRWNDLGLSIQTAGYRAKELPADYQLPTWTQGVDDYSTALQFTDQATVDVKKFLIDADNDITAKKRKNAEKYWKEYEDRAAAAMDQIKSLVSSGMKSTEDWIRVALQGTSADVGEAWDEMARRAEAVANDVAATGTSPWLAMFDIPQDILEQGGDTLKAYMEQIAADIRESPTVQELGSVGIDAMVANIKKELADQIGRAELEQTVALKLASDPEAVQLMEQLGIDVGAAVSGLEDPIVSSIEGLKTATLGTNVENFPAMFTEESAQALLGSIRDEIVLLGDKTLNVEVTNFGDLKISDLMSFDIGGRVPGAAGEPQLAVVHGKETVLPVGQTAHNYYLTVNSRSEKSVIREFAIMRSLAGA